MLKGYRRLMIESDNLSVVLALRNRIKGPPANAMAQAIQDMLGDGSIG